MPLENLFKRETSVPVFIRHAVRTWNFRIGWPVESIPARIEKLTKLQVREFLGEGHGSLMEVQISVKWSYLPRIVMSLGFLGRSTVSRIGAILAVFRDPHTIAGKKGRHGVNQG